MKEEYYREQEIFSLLISVVILFLTIYIVTDPIAEAALEIDGFNKNFAIYVLVCVLFFITYGVSFLGGKYIYHAASGKEFPFLKYIMPCVTVLFIGNWLVQIYLHENLLYPENSAPQLRHEMPMLYACATLLSCAIFAYFLLKKEVTGKVQVRILFAILIAVAGGILFYTPVLHRGDLNAYFNSIYETLNGYPYTDIYTSIYGHYAILYAIPIKVLGGSVNDIYRVITMVGIVTFVSIFIALANVIKHDDIYFLTCIAIIGRYIVYFGGGNYYQVIPHRWLFPAIFVLLWSLNKTGTVMEVVSYILLVLSIVWNLDSGLVLLMAYSGYRIYEHIRKRGLTSLMPDIVQRIFLGTGCFLAAYSIVGIYNISMGGKWGTVKDFIYPYLSEGYHIVDLMLKLPGTAAVYGVIIAVMLGMMSVSACRLFFRRADWLDGVKFFVALIGSGMMFYYMNRAAYGNVACSSIECTFLLGMFLDEIVGEFHINRSRHYNVWEEKGSSLSCYILGFFVLLFMSSYMVETVVYYGKHFHEKMELRDLSERYDFADKVEESIPRDTFAFGIGIPELYYQLGWDTECHVMDWADLNDKSRKYIQNKVMTGEMFFAEESAIYSILPDGYYPKYEKEFSYSGTTYYYANLQYIPELGSSLDTGFVLSGISDEGWLEGTGQFMIRSGELGKIILQYEAEENGIFRIWVNGNGLGDYEYEKGSGEVELTVQPEEESRVLIFFPYGIIKEDGTNGVRLVDVVGE